MNGGEIECRAWGLWGVNWLGRESRPTIYEIQGKNQCDWLWQREEKEWEYGRVECECFLPDGAVSWKSLKLAAQRAGFGNNCILCGSYGVINLKTKMECLLSSTSFHQDFLHHLLTGFHYLQCPGVSVDCNHMAWGWCYGKQARINSLTVGSLWKLGMLKQQSKTKTGQIQQPLFALMRLLEQCCLFK